MSGRRLSSAAVPHPRSRRADSPAKPLSANATGKTPAHLAQLDPPVNRVRTEMPVLTEKRDSPASLETPLQWLPVLTAAAESAPTVPKAQPDLLDPLDPQDLLVAPDPRANLDSPANPDPLDLQAHLAQPESTANPARREPQVPPDPEAARDSPAPRVPPAKTDPQAPLVPLAPRDPMANPVQLDPQDLQVPQAPLDQLARTAPLAPRDPPARMPSTAPAPSELAALSSPRSKPPATIARPSTAASPARPVSNRSQLDIEPLALLLLLLGHFGPSRSQTRPETL